MNALASLRGCGGQRKLCNVRRIFVTLLVARSPLSIRGAFPEKQTLRKHCFTEHLRAGRPVPRSALLEDSCPAPRRQCQRKCNNSPEHWECDQQLGAHVTAQTSSMHRHTSIRQGAAPHQVPSLSNGCRSLADLPTWRGLSFA